MQSNPGRSQQDPGTEDALPCKRCGVRAVRPHARPGRFIRFRNLAALSIPADFPILTCSRCGAETVDAKTRQKLAPPLEAEYRAALRVRICQTIDLLAPHISQRRLEHWLGLSQGYLSRLRAGAGNPSAELVSNLALLSMDPRVRLQELEDYWSRPSFPVSSAVSHVPQAD